MSSPVSNTSSSVECNRKSNSCSSAYQKSNANLYYFKQMLAKLMGEKKKWLNAQRKASLLVQPCKTDELGVMSKFAPLLRAVAAAQVPAEQYQAQSALIEQIIQESIIIEWPKILHEKCLDGDSSLVGVELDLAPLIHRARNVVKCRTPHPTMRVRVCAIAEADSDMGHLQVVEAFFRATLVKLSGDNGERRFFDIHYFSTFSQTDFYSHQCIIFKTRHIAGRLILTQREGTPAAKYHEQGGAIANTNGKLLASQAALDCSTNILLEQYDENAKRTDFRYEHGTLCAVFPELGVTLNSMVDRRQLSTRYAIQVDVALNIGKLIVKHAVLSHEFLIAITNDQTESLLNFIFWPRLLDTEQLPEQSNSHGDLTSRNDKVGVPWRILKNALKYFVKSQHSSARALHLDELLHIQCMLFYPRIKIASEDLYEKIEENLFGNVKSDGEGNGAEKLKQRLLSELVDDDVVVTKNEFMLNKCISLVDGSTELRHNLWQWLYRSTEMIIDVGHKFCPVTSNIDKKCAKAKKQALPVNENQSMLSLFNNRILTLTSAKNVSKIFKAIEENDKKNCAPLTNALYMRFCDENIGHISFAFSNLSKNGGKPLMGSLSSDQIKDFKQGIVEILMDEAFFKHYDHIVQLPITRCSNSESSNDKLLIATPFKTAIFHDYNTMRLQNNCVEISDNETTRINPLTGEKLTCSQDNVKSNNSDRGQNPEDESLSNFALSYVQLLLHAKSVYDMFDGTVTAETSSNSSGIRITPNSSHENSNIDKTNKSNTNKALKNETSSHFNISSTAQKSNEDFVNVRKRSVEEMTENESEELRALDLTKKRVKRNSS